MRKIKVLNIIGRRPQGGIGAVVYNYQSHFCTDQVQMDYLLFAEGKDGDFDRKVRAFGSKVYVLSPLKNTKILSARKQIRQFFAEHGHEYEIAHVHSVNIMSLCYSMIRKSGIKHLIAHSHSTMYSEKRLNSIRNSILCLFIKKQADILMACSKAAGEFLYGKKAVAAGKVKILNNAVDCSKFCFKQDVRDEYRKLLKVERKFVIGHVGRFCAQKNHGFLLKIFLEIKNKQHDSVLLLVGDGELKEAIQEQAKDLGLNEDIIFLGTRSDVANILQAMDLFLLPSLFEGLPVVGLEAQGVGLPCVFSDNVTNEVGIINSEFLKLSESATKWADDILHILKEFKRSDTCPQLKAAGFDITEEAKKLEEFYLSLV